MTRPNGCMLRAPSGRVKVTVWFAVWLIAGGIGCYWYRYADLARTHTELLTALIDKLCARQSAMVLTGAALAEYEYPLGRARDFARIAAMRCPCRRSLTAFRRVLALYQRIVADAARGGRDGCRHRSRLALRVRRVHRMLAREPHRCA